MLVKLSEILVIIPIKEVVVGPKPGPAEHFRFRDLIVEKFHPSVDEELYPWLCSSLTFWYRSQRFSLTFSTYFIDVMESFLVELCSINMAATVQVL